MDQLDKCFTMPKILHRDRNDKFPRKLKKKLRKIRDASLSLREVYWEYIGIINPKYKAFLIKKILEQDDAAGGNV